MTNIQIYRKTLGFSVRRFFWDIFTILLLAAITFLGFFIAEKVGADGLIGLVIGLVVGIIVIALVFRYLSYGYKAGQIAMMTKGITEGELPDNVYKEGKKIVKERFGTVTAFFFITGAIKGVFEQIGRGITKLGEKIGGETGGTIGSVISSAMQTVISYLSDCCLGWVFYRKDEKAVKATLEGSAIFFKHGKTLAKNMGRVFGMGLVSFLLIGGAFAGIFYFVFTRFPQAFINLAGVIAEAAAEGESTIPAFLYDPTTLTIACAVLAGAIIWSIIHSVFIKPLVLVGVLRNYLQSGIEDMPTEEAYDTLDKMSPKFRKLHNQLA
jgi:hypothetical protein